MTMLFGSGRFSTHVSGDTVNASELVWGAGAITRRKGSKEKRLVQQALNDSSGLVPSCKSIVGALSKALSENYIPIRCPDQNK